MNILLSFCSTSETLHIFYIFKICIKIFCIFIPIILMYNTIKLIIPLIISGEAISSKLTPIFKSIIASLAILCIPTILNFLFETLANFNNQSIINCFNSATVEKINEMKSAEETERQKNKEEKNKKMKEEAEQERQKYLEEKRKREEAANQKQNNSSDNKTDYYIFIGDSRTVGLCIAMTGNSNRCEYSNGGTYINNQDIYIAQSGTSYSWFNSTAVPEVNNIIKNNSNKKYTIITNMGVNNLLGDVDNYISKYNSLANNEWKKQNKIFLSVNPVNETLENQNGYSTKNSDIETFNKKIQNNVKNFKYCNSYQALKNSFQTIDGLHYTNETYQTIYNYAKSCTK